MQLNCPKCGSRDTRVPTRRTFGQLIKTLFGVYPLRCRLCQTRWETSMWADGAWKYAHCPRCYRQDLTTWSTQYYSPPSSVAFKLSLGAKQLRCAACRYNFASFRPWREKFEWRHQVRDIDMEPFAGTASPKTKLHSPDEADLPS